MGTIGVAGLSGCVIGVMADSRSGWHMWLRLVTAGLGVFMGSMVFFVFTFGYGNIAAGSWALISAMFAGLVLHLHIVHRMHRLELWYSAQRLVVLRGISLGGLAVSTIVSIYYAYLAVSTHQPVYPIRDSLMIAAVW
eukprot:TRINITY_DN9213_c0_g1_i1.p1 TRINITY_DN9213_c0_g1~~TRINITY_DN9213_c0_g1_i1.p1  ORF type:complete len:151 (+),score=49.82 TRINITY_DN9213_c0_g1_i1:45-455(+)